VSDAAIILDDPPVPREPLIHFVCWKWRGASTAHTRYTHWHVMVLQAMLQRTMSKPFRLICVTDDMSGIDRSKVACYKMWQDLHFLQNKSGAHLPSCYRRLKLFDRKTQAMRLEIPEGELIVSIDLDAIVLTDLYPLLTRCDEALFTGWKVRGHAHAEVYNGSMWAFKAGDHLQWMWDLFNPDTSPDLANKAGYFGSDQSFLSHQLLHTQGTKGWGKEDGVYSYPRDVRATRVLPADSRVVFFHGKRKPWDMSAQREAKWIPKYWRI
jgi:hypothetical protein